MSWIPTIQTAEDFYSGTIKIDLKSIYHTIFVPNSHVGVNLTNVSYPFGSVSVNLLDNYDVEDITEDINGRSIKSIYDSVFLEVPLGETRVLNIWKAFITAGDEEYNEFQLFYQVAIYKFQEDIEQFYEWGDGDGT